MIELDPGHVLARAERGGMRGKQGDLPGALSDLDRALELDPDCALALLSRAAARRERGDLPGTLADYERWLQRSGDDPRGAPVREEVARLRREVRR